MPHNKLHDMSSANSSLMMAIRRSIESSIRQSTDGIISEIDDYIDDYKGQSVWLEGIPGEDIRLSCTDLARYILLGESNQFAHYNLEDVLASYFDDCSCAGLIQFISVLRKYADIAEELLEERSK